MKKMFKISAYVLAGAMVATVAGGCAKKTGGGNSDVSVINVWTGDSHSKLEVTKLVDEYNKTIGAKEGIKIVYTVKEGDYNQIVDMAITSKQAPDMFTTYYIDKYSESGDIIALEDLPGGKELIDKYDPQLLNVKEFTATDGKVYKLPYNITTFGLVYNKDMFKRYGIVDENGEAKPPKTLAELREDAKIMTDPSKQDFGIIMPIKWNAFYEMDIAALGLASGGTIGYNPVKGEYDYSVLKPVFDLYMGLKEDNSVFPGSEGLDNDAARAQFAERNIAMKFAGSYDVGVYNEQFPAKCDWGVAPMPVEDEANRYKQQMTLSGYLVVNKNSVDKIGADKLMKVYEWFHSDDMLRSLYEMGLAIPYSEDIIASADVKETKKGWKEFADLVAVSYIAPDSAPTDVQGAEGMKEIFLNHIWSGEISADEGIAQANKVMNDGIKRRLENDSNIDINRYIKPDWNIELK